MSSRKSTREELIYSLIYEKIAPLQDVYQSDIMERWHLIESVVKEIYTWRNIESVWFLRRTDNEYLGISPDGIEIIDEQIKHAIEVKWPLGKNFIKYWLWSKIPDDYYHQVLAYFLVIETLETLDFIVHNPEPYDANVRTMIIRVTREELKDDIMRANMQIFEFLVEWTKLTEQFVANVIQHTKKSNI